MLKRKLGSYAYAGQFQQRPSPAGGGIFKKWWWRYWTYKTISVSPVLVRLPDGTMRKITAVILPDDLDSQLQSWDMAFKDLSTSDYVAGGVAQASHLPLLRETPAARPPYRRALQNVVAHVHPRPSVQEPTRTPPPLSPPFARKRRSSLPPACQVKQSRSAVLREPRQPASAAPDLSAGKLPPYPRSAHRHSTATIRPFSQLLMAIGAVHRRAARVHVHRCFIHAVRRVDLRSGIGPWGTGRSPGSSPGRGSCPRPCA